MTNFTTRQKEIVARKLGYDGPMQGFDEYINSSPSLITQYSMLSDKFATRMAKGGAVRKKYAAGGLVSDDDVRSFLAATPNMTDALLRSKMDEFGVSAEQMARVTGLPVAAIQQRYNAAAPAAPATAAPAATKTVAAPTPAPAATKTTTTTKAATPLATAKTATPAKAVTPAVSTTDIRNYLAANANLTDAQIKAKMDEFGVTPAQMSEATGIPVQQIQQRYNKPSTASNADIQRFLAQPNLTDAQIKEKMVEFNVSPAQMAAVTGVSQADVEKRFAAAAAPKTVPKTATPAPKAITPVPTTPVVPPVPTTPVPEAGTTSTTPSTTGNITGAPAVPGATTYTAAQTATPTAVTPVTAAPTVQAGVTEVAAPTLVTAPAPITAPVATAATSAPAVAGVLSGVEAQQGVLSEDAKAIAAYQAPETTAVAGMEAAQGVAGTVQNAPTRTAQAGEMVSGPAVDMAKVEQTLAQTQAAQGVVTEEMTVQGQLNKLTKDFDAGNPPPWAAASMRAATAQLAARGLGASSIAGQAIIQATLEAATPIAAADAKVFEQMGLQNLSNRQQVAMLIGQQRAAFLGQEFDQAFQTRVMNAAKVSDIANKNFDAQTQIAIENSRLANTMDIANLSARNAVVLGKMAQMSQLETMNLNNRQQVAVENARSVLAMDMKNLDNRQQTSLFKAQELNDALTSDAGFANAVNITNSQNKLEADKVSATLALTASQFNSDMINKVNMANATAANELSKFNAQQANAREEFNSNMVNQINMANAKLLAEVSTANTAAINAANAVNAKNATDLSAAAYAQQSQTYRDLLEQSWKTGESTKDRITEIAKSTLVSNASTTAAKTTASTNAIATIGGAALKLASNDKVWNAVTTGAGNAWDALTGAFSSEPEQLA
jgi:hypothetical protein